MRVKQPRVLIVGSHPDSGFSMLNFSRDTKLALDNLNDSAILSFKAPKSIFFRFIRIQVLKKYATYADKFLLFGPYLTFLTSSKRIDLIHILDHSDAPYRFYVSKNCSIIVTVHDLFAIEAARGEIPGVSIDFFGKIYQRVIERGLKGSNLVLPVSESTRSSVNQRFPELQTRVVHNFVFTQMLDIENQVANISNFPAKYFLVLMNSHWRKNRITCIRVWKKITSDANFTFHRLIIVGNPLTALEWKLIGDSKNLVEIRQTLSHREIETLYDHCAAVINISLYEGFGMPIIEANLHRKISIFGGSAAFKEIAGPENIEYSDDLAINTSELFLKLNSQSGNRAFEYASSRYTEKNFRIQMNKIYEEYLR